MISFFKKILDFYIHGSIHVAFAVYALVQMTFYFFHITYSAPMSFFAFFGTIVGYNFVKYDELVRTKKLQINTERKAIVILSGISFLATSCCFFLLERSTQMVSVVFLGLTILYTLPVIPKMRNLRNWAGIKIYIVAFCWAGVTVLLPVINASLSFNREVTLQFSQCFILVIILILIFDIIDLKNDAVILCTVPQKIGVQKTKLVNLFLLIPFYGLEYLKSNFQNLQLSINLVLITVLAFFTIFASPKRPDYYTSFWVESIPVFWWLLVLNFYGNF